MKYRVCVVASYDDVYEVEADSVWQAEQMAEDMLLRDVSYMGSVDISVLWTEEEEDD